MTGAKKLERVSVAEYLAGEAMAPTKHEYVGGIPYAMAPGRNVHNRIAGRIFVGMYNHLRGKPFEPFNSNTRIRIRSSFDERFYYPDASVVCRPNPETDSFQDEPVVIFEVLSQKTRRIDEGEKKDAYTRIPALAVYVLVEQSSPSVVAWRRTGDGFVRETYEGLDAVVPLLEIDTQLLLADVYEGIDFAPERDDDT